MKTETFIMKLRDVSSANSFEYALHELQMKMAGEAERAGLYSEDDVVRELKSIRETLYLHSIPGMAESIIEAGKEPLSECKTYDPNEEW